MSGSTKICTHSPCEHNGTPQPVAQFYRQATAKDGLNPYCRGCYKEIGREWRRVQEEDIRREGRRFFIVKRLRRTKYTYRQIQNGTAEQVERIIHAVLNGQADYMRIDDILPIRKHPPNPIRESVRVLYEENPPASGETDGRCAPSRLATG